MNDVERLQSQLDACRTARNLHAKRMLSEMKRADEAEARVKELEQKLGELNGLALVADVIRDEPDHVVLSINGRTFFSADIRDEMLREVERLRSLNNDLMANCNSLRARVMGV